MKKTSIKAIKKIIKVCDTSINSEKFGSCFREPIGKSDTYMIRNTLQSVIKLESKSEEK